MICPKCKNEIEDKSLKCPSCGAKIGAICKDCGTYNLITAIKCSGCEKELLKICPECNAANLPESKLCRKCGANLSAEKKDLDSKLKYSANVNSQQKVRERLVEGIKSADSKIITVCGESGRNANVVNINLADGNMHANHSIVTFRLFSGYAVNLF